MRRWSAHALVLTVLVLSAILTSRVNELSPATPDSATTPPQPPDTGLEADTNDTTTVATQPAPENPGGFTARVERWRGLSQATSDVVHQATGVSIDNNLLLALVAVESGGDPAARSPAGAVGLTQVEPATFGDLQKHYRGVLATGSLEQPRTNLLAGGIYLAECARQLHADLADPTGLDLALKAYNLGPSAASEWWTTGTWLDRGEIQYALPTETLQHSARIVTAYQSAISTSPQLE
jgi:Transglycosylase SLT domain